MMSGRLDRGQTVLPPYGGVRNSLGSDCLPGLIRGPLGLPQTVYHCGGDYLQDSGGGAIMEQLWGLLQRAVRPWGVDLHTLGLRSRSQAPP